MVCLDDFEKFAVDTLSKNALDYYRSGANDEVTLNDNIAAFRRYVQSYDVQRSQAFLHNSSYSSCM